MTRKVRANIFAGLFACFIGVAGCTKDESVTSPAPVANPNSPITPAPSPATEATPPGLESAISGDSTIAAAQVSETSDGEEPEATPASSVPPLKLAAAPPQPASRFKEGVHYRRLSPTQPTSVSPGSIEVVEVFWYGCPHCFQLDTKLETWQKQGKADYVSFERLPAMWNEITRFHGRLYYTAQVVKKTEELHATIFQEIHANNNPLNTVERAKSVFLSQGVTAAAFQNAFASADVENRLLRADLLNRRYRVSSVPTFIVNGKYTADVESAGGEAELIALLNDLAALEHGD